MQNMHGMVTSSVKYLALGIFYVNGIGISLSINFFLHMIMNKCVEFARLLFHNAFSAESQYNLNCIGEKIKGFLMTSKNR